MTDEELIQVAIEEGFANAAVVQTDKLVFDPSFRPYCEENHCGQYGINFSCPPSCGSPEQMNALLAALRTLMEEKP